MLMRGVGRLVGEEVVHHLDCACAMTPALTVTVVGEAMCRHEEASREPEIFCALNFLVDITRGVQGASPQGAAPDIVNIDVACSLYRCKRSQSDLMRAEWSAVEDRRDRRVSARPSLASLDGQETDIVAGWTGLQAIGVQMPRAHDGCGGLGGGIHQGGVHGNPHRVRTQDIRRLRPDCADLVQA